MENDSLIDISDVCEQFDISSRTLRFYEEKGLIQSERAKDSKRRKYNKSQIEQIKNVLVLRSMGLSVKAIQDYLAGNVQLKEIVNLKRAEINASISTELRESRLLNNAYAAIEDGESIFNLDAKLQKENATGIKQISRRCSEFILNNELDNLYSHFSRQMKEYMPPDSFAKVWEDTILGGGSFVEFGKTVHDFEYQNIVYQYMIFQKMTLRIKYVFHGDIIHGLWLQYCESE